MVENTQQEYVDDSFYDDEDQDTQKDKYLTFSLAEETYGLGIGFVTEIVGIQRITEVPDMPEYVKGVINLRGKVIPVMDVRIRFGMGERDYDDRTCVIVVNMGDNPIGLVVDTVDEVLDIPENNVTPPPRISKGGGSRYLQGMGKVGDEVKILLDVNKLLMGDELDSVASIAE